jgi:hypothetical protein
MQILLQCSRSSDEHEICGVTGITLINQKTTHHGDHDAAATSHVWRKPPAGMLKCNVDMAFYASQNCYCIAACLRDDRGHFVRVFA